MISFVRTLAGGLSALVLSMGIAAGQEGPAQPDPEREPGAQCVSEAIQGKDCSEAVDALGLAIGAAIRECSEFRICKTECRIGKDEDRNDCRDIRNASLRICADMPRGARRECRKEARQAYRGCRSDAGTDRRRCKVDCREGMTDACLEARAMTADIAESFPNCAIDIALSLTCAPILTTEEERDEAGEGEED